MISSRARYDDRRVHQLCSALDGGAVTRCTTTAASTGIVFFGALLDQYLGVVRSGLPMPPASVARAEAAVASLKGRSMSHQAVDDITERAVEWVCLNPVLVEADLPDVGR